jgi:hypothetical protein
MGLALAHRRPRSPLLTLAPWALPPATRSTRAFVEPLKQRQPLPPPALWLQLSRAPSLRGPSVSAFSPTASPARTTLQMTSATAHRYCHPRPHGLPTRRCHRGASDGGWCCCEAPPTEGWPWPPQSVTATINAGGCYHRRWRVLPSMLVAATIDAGGCYHRRSRLLPSTPATSNCCKRRC